MFAPATVCLPLRSSRVGHVSVREDVMSWVTVTSAALTSVPRLSPVLYRFVNDEDHAMAALGPVGALPDYDWIRSKTIAPAPM